MEIFVGSALPQGRKSKSKMRFTPSAIELIAGKLDVMLHRSYLEEGFVESKVHFFGVPKGDDDIRVVFDGTSGRCVHPHFLDVDGRRGPGGDVS
jgi:hypothetical protein